jgi:biotin-(acetyl-CoA carboxylase) ligase
MTTTERIAELGSQYGTSCADSDERGRPRTRESLTLSASNTVRADVMQLVVDETWDEELDQDERDTLCAIAIDAARSAWAAGWSVGDHVEAGDTDEDYDHGRILEIDELGRCLVAWVQAQVQTWQSGQVLRRYQI